jgi:hypothetical protein
MTNDMDDAEDGGGEHAPHPASVNGENTVHSCSKAYGVSSRLCFSKARSARNRETPGCSPPTRLKLATFGVAPGGMELGQIEVTAHTLHWSHLAGPREFKVRRQVGQESQRRPAGVEKAAPHSSPSDPVSPVVRDQNVNPFSSQAVRARLSLLLS